MSRRTRRVAFALLALAVVIAITVGTTFLDVLSATRAGFAFVVTLASIVALEGFVIRELLLADFAAAVAAQDAAAAAAALDSLTSVLPWGRRGDRALVSVQQAAVYALRGERLKAERTLDRLHRSLCNRDVLDVRRAMDDGDFASFVATFAPDRGRLGRGIRLACIGVGIACLATAALAVLARSTEILPEIATLSGSVGGVWIVIASVFRVRFGRAMKRGNEREVIAAWDDLRAVSAGRSREANAIARLDEIAVLLLEERWQDALDAFEHVSVDDLGQVHRKVYTNNLAWALVHVRAEEAIRVVEPLLSEIGPSHRLHSNAVATLAMAHLRAGDARRGRELFESITNAPDLRPRLLSLYGEMLHELGDDAAARATLSRAMTLGLQGRPREKAEAILAKLNAYR